MRAIGERMALGWILNCREATRLVSRGLDDPLPRGRGLLLRAHLFWCGPCRNFVRQMRLLRRTMRRYGGAAEFDPDRPCGEDRVRTAAPDRG